MKIRVFFWLVITTLSFLIISQSLIAMGDQDLDLNSDKSTLTEMEHALKNGTFDLIIKALRRSLQNYTFDEQRDICTNLMEHTKIRKIKSKMLSLILEIDHKEKRTPKSKNKTLYKSPQLLHHTNTNISAIIHPKTYTKDKNTTVVKIYDNQVARGYTNGTLEIYTDHNFKILGGHTDAVSSLDFYDNNVLVSSSNEKIIVSDIRNYNFLSMIYPAGILDDRDEVTALTVGCKSLLLAATLDGTLHIMNNTNKDLQDAPRYAKTHQIKAHDDKITAIGKINEIGYISGSSDSTSKIWDLEIQHIQTQKHSGKVTAIEIGDNFFATVLNNKVLEVWNNLQQSPLYTFYEVERIKAFAVDNTHIVMGFDSGKIEVIDLRNPRNSNDKNSIDSAINALSLNNNKLKVFADDKLLEFNLKETF